MRFPSGPRLVRAAFLGFFVFAAGCGSGGLVPVAGKLVENGKPLQKSKNESVQLTFRSNTEPPKSFPAALDADGNFTVSTGTDARGIPPGKYTLTVSAASYMPGAGDRFKKSYGPGSSRLACEVGPTGATNLVVDVGTGTVSQ
jgi:hypothetical protein